MCEDLAVPLPLQSHRTKQKRATRAEIVKANRRAYICELGRLGGCGGTIESHEIVRRGQTRDAEINRQIIVALCSNHHKLDGMKRTAERHGIRIPGWAWQQYGMRAAAEAKRIRMGIFFGQGPRDPFWFDDELPALPHPDSATLDS